MPMLSDVPQWEEFGTRLLFTAPTGGADFGECIATVGRIGSGDGDAWHAEWQATARGLVAAADESRERGHAVSAREAYLRAANYHRTSYQPLYGEPVDPRLTASFGEETAALTAALALQDFPAELVEIPFEGASLPGLLARPARDDRPRPTIVYTNGYDSDLTEMFIAHVAAAISRDWNILLYDGPGQGRNLIRDGLRMRPDWETVAGPVVDWVLEQPGVDPDRVVLCGWSFGGFLAPRAAAFDPRLAALVADPGQWDQWEAIKARLPLTDEQKASFPDGVPPDTFKPMEDWLSGPDGDAGLRWRLLQRGLWVHGVPTLFDYFKEMRRFEVSPVAGGISCPALLTAAEDDPMAAFTPRLAGAMTGSPKVDVLRFTAAEGAGGHCEGTARLLYHQRVFDWLDETVGRA